MIRNFLYATTAIFLASAGIAHAAFIVDTGPEPTGLVSGVSLLGPESPSGFQFYAGQFTTTQAWVVTGVEGWISLAGKGETATAVIYANDSGLPGIELFAAAFAASGESSAEWEGADGLSWVLPAGTYFVGFEVRTGQTMAAAMPSGVPFPLAAYAFFSQNVGSWRSDPVNTLGFRIDASPVPLPAALPLFGVTIMFLVAMRRKR